MANDLQQPWGRISIHPIFTFEDCDDIVQFGITMLMEFITSWDLEDTYLNAPRQLAYSAECTCVIAVCVLSKEGAHFC